jgi:membrane-associated phospholipid phosphatase
VRGANGALALAGLALFEGSRILAAQEVTATEKRFFHWANDAPDELRAPVRAIMQAGTFGTVPVVAALALLAGRRRLAAEVAIGGTAAWLLAKQAKPLGGRPRPSGVLRRVRTRESIAGDLGWVSGHAAVSTTLALTLSRAVPDWARPALGGVVAVTGFGRMYVGAHLPLDLVGGAGLGMMIAAAVRRLGDDVAAAARRRGYEAGEHPEPMTHDVA